METKYIKELVTTKAVTDEYGEPIKLHSRPFDFLFFGDGVATVAIQKSIEDPAAEGFDEDNWRIIQEYDWDGDEDRMGDQPGEEPVIAWYRAGLSAYTSGSVTMVFRQFRQGVSGD